MLTGTFDGSPSEVAVLVTQNPTAQWRVIEELDGVDELTLRPGQDEAWAVRAGGLVRIDLARLTVEPMPIAGSGLGQLAFSGDGTTLFVTVDDRVLSLDVSRSELAAPTLIARLPSAALQMSADTIGARVAVNLDGGPVLLDVASGEAFTVGQSFARQVAFLPSGDLLVIDDFAAKVVGFDHDLLDSVACRVAGRVQTPEEWERYGPEDAPYAPTCAA